MNGVAVVKTYREYWNYYACYIDMVASYEEISCILNHQL